MKKITAHASGRNYVLIVSDLTDFCAYHLGNTCPACQPDHNREAEYICFSQDCLKKDDQQKGRNAKKNFCKTHEEAVSHWGAIPQKEPITIARKVEIKVDNTPIVREILPPYQSMEKISLPMVSVPNKNSLFGA